MTPYEIIAQPTTIESTTGTISRHRRSSEFGRTSDHTVAIRNASTSTTSADATSADAQSIARSPLPVGVSTMG